MMKKWIIGLLTGMMMLSVTAVYAADGMKVGVIDMREILQTSTRIKQVSDSLNEKFTPAKNKIMAAQAALQKEQDKLNRETSVMSATDRNKLQEKIMADRQGLQKMQESFFEDARKEQTKAMEKTLNEVSNIVVEIAKQQKFDIVLQKETTIYARDDLNITAQVLKKFDAGKATASTKTKKKS